jgi:hypothetical protein
MLPRAVPFLLLLAILGCAPNGGTLPNDAPYMAGTITSIGRVAEGWTVRVEERPQDVSGSMKGVFRVRAQTTIRRASGARAGAEDLREGQRVRVWVTGPVAESYPVQAAAQTIIIDAAGS